ncbi:Sec-independent protein translocase subunit TatA [Cellulomonas gilvus]|uniref:Sec-independent protein translocase protein TatA n=1 Tax=Cellulomonas gilvus (strain ATCC 13127 / NRRL B-14078) TaxID=593907 RepID=F8A211_CELGA|nr:Sec-independent protein translocase subunit TatA [Cellulomonas gilvus]AEI12955.1 twin-arginine translocation protein, TatA/E family subunit [Cellulomonas gilvus ATCC 13127]
MLKNLSAWHVIVLVGVLILLFGAKRLPELAQGIGQSLRIFKSEIKDLADDEPARPVVAAPAAPAVALRPEPVVPEDRPAA